ncbi:replication initiator [Bailinhaonella thermotolerans]|uniref:Replication initiation protein n=1 Tax=Bailinhaonella thermotolerans TaxID=1070861 RepID=A0A3A4AZL6_9ACTN|nr:replication initiator [Bailinhaonella thermotolerans]RJL34573.1 replication initiation protein [Bailinhaonella thermotolerans]
MTIEDRGTSRASRVRPPLAREVVEAVAVEHGVCIRPVALKRVDLESGKVEIIDAPCGATLESKCPSCAKRAKQLRVAQCREGWHLDHEPVTERADPDEYQRWLMEKRADAQAWREAAERAGEDTADFDALIVELEEELAKTGVRGAVLPGSGTVAKRKRSTRRRQDAPDLPRRKVENRTVGRTFTAPDGKVYRPSLFVTLTCDSYGKVKADGTPVDPAGYDYRRAARDAIHFPKLIDRFVQNLRRVAGYDVQYFATVEPQRRLAPHVHMAVRGTLPRTEVKAVAAATYHQVWWPPCDRVVFDGEHLPVWGGDEVGYLDPATGEVLPTWDQALDALDQDEHAEPLHVVRFGPQTDVKGILSGTPDADRALRYLAKYLTKSIADCHEPDSDDQRAHLARLVEALRYEPCSPTCANWLRYGVQPKNARAGLRPGHCKGKAHKAEHLGYAGRRVLVSRKWSGKTLREHAHDRRAWVLEQLGLSATGDDQATPEPRRFSWLPVAPGDPAVPPITHRLLRAVADRSRWRTAVQLAQARAAGQPTQDLSAIGRAA